MRHSSSHERFFDGTYHLSMPKMAIIFDFIVCVFMGFFAFVPNLIVEAARWKKKTSFDCDKKIFYCIRFSWCFSIGLSRFSNKQFLHHTRLCHSHRFNLSQCVELYEKHFSNTRAAGLNSSARAHIHRQIAFGRNNNNFYQYFFFDHFMMALW